MDEKPNNASEYNIKTLERQQNPFESEQGFFLEFSFA